MTDNNQQQATPTPPPSQPQADWDGQAMPNLEPGFNPHLPAWEQAGSWLGAFFKTTWQVLFKPFLTFQQPAYPGTASLIAFGLPWLVLFSAVSMLYDNFANEAAKLTFTALAFSLLGNCLLFLLSLLLLHLALKIVRADKNGLKATFRACIYLLCTYLWMLIPFIGPILSMVWCLAITFSVLAASQQVSRMRILGALLLCMAIIFCIFMVIVMIVGMTAITSMLNVLMQKGQMPLPW